MANDIDMTVDIENLKGLEKLHLQECYNARYNECNLQLAEKLKNKFYNLYGYWDNWY